MAKRSTISPTNHLTIQPFLDYEYDIETKTEKVLVNGVRSTYSWIPGTNKILYSKITEDNPNWYNVHRYFIYDVDEDEEQD